MSNIIRFLEALGRGPALHRLSAAEYAANIAMFDVDDEQRKTLLSCDHTALSELVGARPKMFFAIYAPDEEGNDDDRREEEPAQDVPPEPE